MNQADLKSKLNKKSILISELESLGLSMHNLNELNDDYELENLLKNIKETYITEYENTNAPAD